MPTETDIKQQVRQFYDQVGWQEIGEGIYQNARYEDLRPVSSEYIHCCHMRVARHLRPSGRFLLDAGSGPIQYPEYLEYSRDYRYRLCVDLSRVALLEARRRIGDRGLFVQADIANLPFLSGVFDGAVSLHAIHHLPAEEHTCAFAEVYRLLAPGASAVVVNGWETPPLTALTNVLVRLMEGLYRIKVRLFGNRLDEAGPSQAGSDVLENVENGARNGPLSCNAVPQGTHVQKRDASWFNEAIGSRFPCQIWVWRSLSVRFLRAFIHERWGGRRLLRVWFWLEERFPHFLGRYGQYPMIVMTKNGEDHELG